MTTGDELTPEGARCVRPGFWKVDGYDVHRTRTSADMFWGIWQYGRCVHIAESLTDARAWIATQVRR